METDSREENIFIVAADIFEGVFRFEVGEQVFIPLH